MKKLLNTVDLIPEGSAYVDFLGSVLPEVDPTSDLSSRISKAPELREKFRYEAQLRGEYIPPKKRRSPSLAAYSAPPSSQIQITQEGISHQSMAGDIPLISSQQLQGRTYSAHQGPPLPSVASPYDVNQMQAPASPQSQFSTHGSAAGPGGRHSILLNPQFQQDVRLAKVAGGNEIVSPDYVFEKDRKELTNRVFIQNLSDGKVCIGIGADTQFPPKNSSLFSPFARLGDIPDEIWESYHFKALFHGNPPGLVFITEQQYSMRKEIVNRMKNAILQENEGRKDRDTRARFFEGSSADSIVERYSGTGEFVNPSAHAAESIEVGSAGAGGGLSDFYQQVSSGGDDAMTDSDLQSFMNSQNF